VPDEAEAVRVAYASSRAGDLLVLCVASGAHVLQGLGVVSAG